jgi:hypothetical protein
MSKKIFFSYGHDENKEFVFKVARILERHGFEVFLDNNQLKAGKDWEYKLEQGIQSHDKMVFFITPHSARRPKGYCLNEISMAIHLDKDIIPVMLDYYVPPLSIIRLQFLDMQPFKDETKIEKFVNQLIQVLNGNRELDFEGNYSIMYKKLLPEDFTQDFNAHQKIIGRKWVRKKIDNWIKKHKKSKVLWITAEAGYGKSALSTYLALSHPDVVGIHFCSYNYPNKNNPINVIKTLAYHFQSQIEGYSDEIINVDVDNKNVFELYEQLIANPLLKVKNKGKKFIIVIDALDEVPKNSELLELIGSKEFQLGLPEYVKIIITSRPDPQLKQTLSNLNPIVFDVRQENNLKDCKKFIKRKLKNLKYCKYAEDKVFVTNILKKSVANMLYLNIFFDELEKKNIDINNPHNFPQNLNGIYQGFFRRITKDKEKYRKYYAPLLEVVLGYGEAIPKVLLKNILVVDSVNISDIIVEFGSMIKEDNGKIDLYHKSLKDWLLMEENYSYRVSVKKGETIIQTFIYTLTTDKYKDEYVEFHALNNKLIQNSYQSKKTLNNFFKLIKSKSKKKIISMLEYEAEYFTLHEQNRIAIELQEKIYLMLKKLTINNEKWAKKYSMILHNLAVNYRVTHRGNKEGFNLQIENLELCEYHYIKEPELWAGEYIIALNDLATSYSGIKNHPKALALGKKSLAICEKLYEVNPDKWVKYYVLVLNDVSIFLRKKKHKLDSISMAKKSLLICKELYNANPLRWTAEYIKAIDTLAVSYSRLNSIKVNYKNEAFELLKINLKLCKTLYKENENRWANEYNISLASLANYYKIIDKQKKAIKLGEKSLAVRKKFYKINPNKWKYKYLSGLKLLTGKSYFQVKKSDVRLKLLEELHKVQLDVYDKDSNSVKKTLLAIKVTKENCLGESGKKYKKCCGKN